MQCIRHTRIVPAVLRIQTVLHVVQDVLQLVHSVASILRSSFPPSSKRLSCRARTRHSIVCREQLATPLGNAGLPLPSPWRGGVSCSSLLLLLSSGCIVIACLGTGIRGAFESFFAMIVRLSNTAANRENSWHSTEYSGIKYERF